MEFKSPNEVHDFQMDYSDELGADTINTSTWTLDSGITKDSDSNTDTTVKAWVSSGTLGKTYKVLNKIVTEAGRTHEKVWYLRIQEQRAG